MLHLQAQPQPSLPFSDWLARVERVIQRQTGVCISLRGQGLRAYYQAGISPLETAEDWITSC